MRQNKLVARVSNAAQHKTLDINQNRLSKSLRFLICLVY